MALVFIRQRRTATMVHIASIGHDALHFLLEQRKSTAYLIATTLWF